MTDAEKALWSQFRAKKIGCKYRRQVAIGTYIVDFCCAKHRIAIEVDGGIHKKLRERDVNRDEYIQAVGFQVLRFSNEYVLNDISKVLEAIQIACKTSHPPPLRQSGEG